MNGDARFGWDFWDSMCWCSTVLCNRINVELTLSSVPLLAGVRWKPELLTCWPWQDWDSSEVCEGEVSRFSDFLLSLRCFTIRRWSRRFHILQAYFNTNKYGKKREGNENGTQDPKCQLLYYDLSPTSGVKEGWVLFTILIIRRLGSKNRRNKSK
jgi:hypothetical protein